MKVIASTFHGATPFHQVNTQYDVLTRVLPLPAPAINRSGPFVVCTAFVAVDLNRLITYLSYSYTPAPTLLLLL